MFSIYFKAKSHSFLAKLLLIKHFLVLAVLQKCHVCCDFHLKNLFCILLGQLSSPESR